MVVAAINLPDEQLEGDEVRIRFAFSEEIVKLEDCGGRCERMMRLLPSK